MTTDEDSPPPLSRWQQLYASSRNDTANSSNRFNYEEGQQTQIDEDSSITAWLETIPSEECTPALHYDEYLLENSLFHKVVENEADKVIDDLELMIRNHDEDFMETILESQRHQDAISEFRSKKKARSFLCSWNSYTKSQLSRRQFLFQAINDMICHEMLKRTFQSWINHWMKYHSEVEGFIAGQKRQRTRRLFCAWVNEAWIQSQRTMSIRKMLLMRKTISAWKVICSTDWKERKERAKRYFQLRVARKWCDQCRHDIKLSLQTKMEQIKRIHEEKEEEEMERNYKVAALVHFLDEDDEGTELKTDDKENIPHDKYSHHRVVSVKPKSRKDNSSAPRRKVNKHQMQSNFMTKRRVLKERHIKARKETEKKALDAKNRTDDEVRSAYLKRKEEEKNIKKRKQHDLEMAKKAWQLAKLHYSLVLLKKCFVSKWINYVRERRLSWTKAVNFWSGGMKSKILIGIFNYTRTKLIQEERDQFLNADRYYTFRFCESVLHNWNNLAFRNHHVLYDKVLKIRLHYTQRRVLRTWKTKLSLRRVQLIEFERISAKLARRNKLSWVMRKLKSGVKESQRERRQEETLALKWQKVRGWLESSD